MQKALDSIFWDFYAFCYDGVRELKPYQDMLEEVLQELDLKPGMRVLDAGCGTGNLEALIAERYPDVEVVAIDFSLAMLQRARQKIFWSNIHFVRLDIDKPLPFGDGRFDRIVCVNTLYNSNNPFDVLGEFKRVLGSSGILVVATPKIGNSPVRILKEHLQVRKKEPKSMRCFIGIAGNGKVILRLIGLAVFNVFIMRRMRVFGADELKKFLGSLSFGVLNYSLCYANQAIRLSAMKLENESDGFICKIAGTEQEKNDVYGLRYRGYGKDLDWIDCAKYPDCLEKDEYDDYAIHFLLLKEGRAVGTLRLIPALDGVFQIEEIFPWPNDLARDNTLEVSRLYLEPEARGVKNMLLLLRMACEYSQKLGYEYLFSATTPVVAHVSRSVGWEVRIMGEKKLAKPLKAKNALEFIPLALKLG